MTFERICIFLPKPTLNSFYLSHNDKYVELPKFIKYLFSEPDSILNARSRKRRDTEEDYDENNADALPRIQNPISCLSSGDMLIFHLTINHTGILLLSIWHHSGIHLFFILAMFLLF